MTQMTYSLEDYTNTADSTDRVLGQVKIPSFAGLEHLKQFDFRAWTNLIPKGQLGLRDITNGLYRGREVVITVNRENENFRDGPYCVRFRLKTGPAQIATSRLKVDRHTKREGEGTCRGYDKMVSRGPKCWGPNLLHVDLMEVCTILQTPPIFGARRGVHRMYGRKCCRVQRANCQPVQHAGVLLRALAYLIERSPETAISHRNTVFLHCPTSFRLEDFLSNWSASECRFLNMQFA